VQYCQKSLFESDTVRENARVTLVKSNDSIVFLHISGMNIKDELIFYQDSVWHFSSQDLKWQLIGSGLKALKGNGLMNFVPLTFFTIHYTGKPLEPYWQTIEEDGDLSTVSIQINEKPAEISDVRIYLVISKADSLVYKIIQDAFFQQYGDNIYQETTIFRYTSIVSTPVIPESFWAYPKVVREAIERDAKEQEEEALRKVMLDPNELHFFTVEGQPVIIPGSGLIFLDFWYAGCFPCLKSSPAIEKIHQEYGQRLTFLAVNEIDRDINKVNRYREKMKTTIPVALNKGEKLATRLTGSNAYPIFLLLDASSGEVLWQFQGYAENLEELARQAIEDHL
jgi:thiol-disulfide isomerase/thioredoxin